MQSVQGVNQLERVPRELLSDILLFLDIKSLKNCLYSNKSLSKVIDENFWKKLTLRDHLHYLCQVPLKNNEQPYPKKTSDIELIKEDEMEANAVITDPFKNPLTEHEIATMKENMQKVISWKSYYLDKMNNIDLSGYWLGDYGAHGIELVKISHKGYKAYAKKITGDPNIPAGKLTWKFTFSENMTFGKGHIHLADHDYQNSRWGPAVFEIVDEDQLFCTWFPGEISPGYVYCVKFAYVRAGIHEFNDDLLERIIGVLKLQEGNGNENEVESEGEP